MSVCTEENDFVRYKSRWVALLSDGSKVYQDDHAPGEAEPIAWIRLKEYVRHTGLKITGLYLQFCDNIVEVAPPNAEGYYYVQGIINLAGNEETEGLRFYTMGHVEGDVAHVQKWHIPANIPMPFPPELRHVSPSDDCVVMNKEDIYGK